MITSKLERPANSIETSTTNSQLAVMEGNGAYNRHAVLPAAGIAHALPMLQEAVRRLELEDDDSPLVIADYGCSQGKNSLGPMGIAIRGLRARVGPDRPVSVFHIDQPSNDFNSLFRVLDSDPDRYGRDDCNVFPHAIGRSFYEQVLAQNSVHLAWSSYAAVWLSRVPCAIPGHFFPSRATGAARAAFESQAKEDWESFLTLRAKEMKRGARLVVTLPTLPDGALPGFANLVDRANDALVEMVADGMITPEERDRMVVTSYSRRKDELLAPFAETGKFQTLVVEKFEASKALSIGWPEYEVTGDKEALANKQALFFRAVFMPSLASALTRVRNGDEDAMIEFADRLQESMIQRLALNPSPMESYAHVIVLAKCE